jgi:RNA polymerase primary sigma factor
LGLACQSQEKLMKKKTQQEREEQNVSLLAFDQYMREVRRLKPLTEQEVAQLLEQVQQGKAECHKGKPDSHTLALAERARDRLVEGYQPFMIYLAKHFTFWCRGLELPDLIQEANLALLRAIEAHDPGKGGSFAAMVGTCVRHHLLNVVRQADGVVSLSIRAHIMIEQLTAARNRLQERLGCEPSVRELAVAMGVSQERVLQVMQWRHCDETVSIEGLLAEEDAEERYTFVDLFETTLRYETERSEQLRQAFEEAFHTVLTGRQREVMQVRYGLQEGAAEVRSYVKVARELGVREQSVFQTDQLAKERLWRVMAPFYQREEDTESA